MFGTIIKTIVAGAATAYAFIGAFSAWVLKETVNDVIDGATAAYNLDHPDDPVGKKECLLTKAMIYLYVIAALPAKIIIFGIKAVKEWKK